MIQTSPHVRALFFDVHRITPFLLPLRLPNFLFLYIFLTKLYIYFNTIPLYSTCTTHHILLGLIILISSCSVSTKNEISNNIRSYRVGQKYVHSILYTIYCILTLAHLVWTITNNTFFFKLSMTVQLATSKVLVSVEVQIHVLLNLALDGAEWSCLFLIKWFQLPLNMGLNKPQSWSGRFGGNSSPVAAASP